MRFSRPLIVLSTVSLLAITACTTSPDPSPDPQTSTSTAPCIPDASQITWKPASDAGLQLIGVSEFVIAADGATTRTDTVLDHETELFDSNANAIARYNVLERDVLLDALIRDVRRTGQVPEDFGDPIDPFAFADFDPESNEGRFLVGFEVAKTRVPFEANCGGGPIDGALSGPVSGGGTATLIQCDHEPETPSPVDPQLRSYC